MSSKNSLIPHKLPLYGPKGQGVTKKEQVNLEGNLVREREYDNDGNPIIDHDHHGGEEVGFDHDHEWDTEGDTPTKGPAVEPDKVGAALVLIGSVISVGVLIADDITGAGAADDVLIPVALGTIVTSWCILFNIDNGVIEEGDEYQ